MHPLYQLVQQHRELARLDPEEIDEQTLLDTLEGLEGEITVKAQSCAATVRNMEVFAETIDAAAKQMKERADRLRRKSEWLRAYLLNNMQAAGISKITAPEFTVSIRKNPPAVIVDENVKLPDEYMVTPPAPPPKPDKQKISAALKAGKTIDGCALVQGERLEIR
jgi:hypothetical protein